MTQKDAREEAVRRWGQNSLATCVNEHRYIVADAIGVRGASNDSFEAAFRQAELLGVRYYIPKEGIE